MGQQGRRSGSVATCAEPVNGRRSNRKYTRSMRLFISVALVLFLAAQSWLAAAAPYCNVERFEHRDSTDRSQAHSAANEVAGDKSTAATDPSIAEHSHADHGCCQHGSGTALLPSQSGRASPRATAWFPTVRSVSIAASPVFPRPERPQWEASRISV